MRSYMKTLVGLSVLCVTLALPPGLNRDDKYLNLEDIFQNKLFNQKTFDGSWISETEILYKDKDNSSLLIFDVTTLESSLVISESDLEALNSTGVSLSKNLKSLLVKSDPEQGFRHSSTSKCAIYDLESGQLDEIAGHQRLQYCEFYGNADAVVYVLKNNLYIKNGFKGTETTITNDGVPGIIYNGIPDWVYEEEVLSSGSAVWFSPANTKLAFASFDDTLVDETVYLTYAEPNDTESQYPEIHKLRYPTVGRKNPIVTLRLAQITGESVTITNLAAPVEEVGDDHILYIVSWISETELAVVWTNRRQNKAVTVIYDETSKFKDLIRKEPKGWIEIIKPIFSNDGTTYLDIAPVSQQDSDSSDRWYHLVKYKKGNNAKKDPEVLTSGRRTVSSIVGWNQEDDKIYYIASTEDATWEQHLYVLSNGTETCISCSIVLPGGDNCTYAQAWPSKHVQYYIVACETYGIPSVTTLYDAEDKPIYIWENNTNLRESLASYVMPSQEIFTHTIADINATVQFFLPPNFRNQKFPMVVDIYTGPNSVRINNRYQLGYQNYMATNKSIIYCKIDGRGTGRKGVEALFAVNNNLGSVEIEDIINITKALADKFPWIDEKRIGLWGWSYGGYATAMALTKDDDNVFKCGVSVAPVITWMYYDTIYTERYMGLPTSEDNLEGYERGDVSRRAEKLRNRNWLLIHGVADDNVHFQNAMLIARTLQKLDIPFKMMAYPNEAHGLSSTLMHVYGNIDDHWSTCFIPDSGSSSWLQKQSTFLFYISVLSVFLNLFLFQ